MFFSSFKCLKKKLKYLLDKLSHFGIPDSNFWVGVSAREKTIFRMTLWWHYKSSKEESGHETQQQCDSVLYTSCQNLIYCEFI